MKNTIIGLFAALLFVSITGCEGNSSDDKGISYIGTKTPTEAKVIGDIVFNDGSATPYTADLSLSEEQKSAAIAIIFYTGTGLNSDINGVANTETSRTLGVGLKHSTTGLAWCRWTNNSDYANAFTKFINTILCPASGSTGALTFVADKDGSDNLEQISEFLSDPSNYTTDDTGTAANYPAFYFAKNYSSIATNLGTIYATGWYLPSIAELFQIYNCRENGVNIVNAASNLCGGDQFGINFYCSSSQYDLGIDCVYALNVETGEVDNCAKTNHPLVCAIREFN